jgi:hypothetical protein
MIRIAIVSIAWVWAITTLDGALATLASVPSGWGLPIGVLVALAAVAVTVVGKADNQKQVGALSESAES